MDFSFSTEQTQLADALNRYLTDHYDFESRKKTIYSEAGVSEAAYAQIAEMGVLALAMPEDADGFGGTAADQILVMQALGKALVVEPVMATLYAAEFIKRTQSPQRLDLLKAVASGEQRLAAALYERDGRYDLFDVRTSARSAGSGYVLNGEKPMVVHGAQADWLVVSARTGGHERDLDNLALLLVDPKQAGVSVREFRTIDGLRAADIKFKDVSVAASEVLVAGADTWPLLDAVSDYGVALACAEAVGTMDALLAQTVAYTKERKQFGQPIAKFQALQHRMVEMFMHAEQARSMCYLAAVRAHSDDAAERRRAVSAAKVRIGQAAKYVGEQAVQLHGGMGVTNELPASHYFKRLVLFLVTLGDIDHHLQRFSAQPVAQAARMALKEAA